MKRLDRIGNTTLYTVVPASAGSSGLFLPTIT
jgi:hypothetical protein